MNMMAYILRRFLFMVVLLLMASVVCFLIITLPPGDYLTSYVAQLKSQGQDVGKAEIAALTKRYGLDQALPFQYCKWVRRFVRGDMGRSFRYNRPVKDIISERLAMTILISVVTLIITYVIAIPIGMYSAVRQYSIFDYAFTAFGFAGFSIPNFLFALILMLLAFNTFGVSIGGLISLEYLDKAWTWAKVKDLLAHLPVPLLVIGLSGTAYLVRVMRATMLDEINKPYVQTARAKGLKESGLLIKYPLRVALNPVVSTIGWAFPTIFSGQTITAIVLNLPTIGPVLYMALMEQDMFLASSSVMITTTLTVLGTFVSDLLLAWLDPRIRYT